MVVWREPSDYVDSWVILTQCISDIALYIVRDFGIGSTVAGQAIKKVSLVLVEGSANASVLVARIGIRILNK